MRMTHSPADSPRGQLAVRITTLCLGLCVSQVAAQESTSLSDVVPESPAFTFLGANPSKVNHPYTPRDLAATLLSAVDSSGGLKQGFALGVTPWYLIPGIRITPEEYAANRLKYLLAWTQLSLGTVRSSGDSASTDLALGIRMTLLDRGDPWTDRNFAPDVEAVFEACRLEHPSNSATLDEVEKARAACIREKFKALRDAWVERHKSTVSLSLGAATGWRFDQSRVSDRDNMGWSAWAALGWRREKRWRVIGQLQYDYRSAIDSQPSGKTLAYGARAALGSERLNTFVEVVGTRGFSLPAGADKGKGNWSWGIEARIAENTWLSTGLGSTFDDQDAPERIVVIANIRWGITSAARLSHFTE